MLRFLFALTCALMVLMGPARSQDATVQSLTSAGALTGTEVLYCQQPSGTDRKCTPAQIAVYFEGLLSGDCTISGNVVTCSKAAPHPGYVTNNWYLPYIWGVSVSGGVATLANTIRCAYGPVVRKTTILNLGMQVSTLAAGGNVQAAMYANSSGRPGALLAATGSMSTAATGAINAALSAAKQVGPGGADGDENVWWCINSDNATAVLIALSVTANTPESFLMGAGAQINVNGNAISSISCAGAACNGGSSTLGTWPASLTGSTWTDAITRSMPLVTFQVQSSP